MKIQKIVVLVELAGGKVHQVLCSHEQKNVALRFFEIDGALKLSTEIEPVEFETINQTKP